MSPDHAATELERLAAFARRVADADRAPAGPTADRAKRLFARGHLLQRWPDARAPFTPHTQADDGLAGIANEMAKECRSKQKGGFLGIGALNDTLDNAAKRLEQLAKQIATPPPLAGPVAALDATLVGWPQADPLTAALLQLETELTARTDAARELLKDLSENPPPFVANRVDAKLPPAGGWTPDSRAAVWVVCAVCEWLSVKTSDPPVWEWVVGWSKRWFAAAGVNGELNFGQVELPGVLVDWVTLQTSKRVSFALAAGPGGDTSEPPAPPTADSPPELVPDADEPPPAEANLEPLPTGLAELLWVGAKLPDGELKGMVVALRAAVAGDYLREAAVQLFIDYHGDAGGTARAADPTATAAVGERLADLLRSEFDLEAFHPANVHDLPGGWVSVAPGSRVMTGSVRRLLRPGLQDSGGNLRMPAVAEVE